MLFAFGNEDNWYVLKINHDNNRKREVYTIVTKFNYRRADNVTHMSDLIPVNCLDVYYM